MTTTNRTGGKSRRADFICVGVSVMIFSPTLPIQLLAVDGRDLGNRRNQIGNCQRECGQNIECEVTIGVDKRNW